MNTAESLQALEKQNRVLQKKLERSEAERRRLEEANRQREALLKQSIRALEDSKHTLEQQSQELNATVMQLQVTQTQLVTLNAELHQTVARLEREICDRKQADDVLRQSEERFRSLVEATSQIICTAQAEGEFVTEQPQWSAFTGQSFEEYSGSGWIAALHPDDRTRIGKIWSDAIANRTTCQVEYRLRRHDGEYRNLSVRAVPIAEPDGRIREWVAACVDISDRKAAEATLRRSEAQLRQQTRDLEQALKELQQTQAQLVQSEKMSSLGQLVAGVAHEINNPVSFIYGNLRPATSYIQDLLHLIDLYQDQYPTPNSAIQAHLEAIDFDFLKADLPQLLTSMKLGADRIKNIVLSLRTFSRMDEAEVKAVDIHAGIDSTLVILEHRLKADHNRPAIQVIKTYGTFPLVECYAGPLNQVFMNILVNAIDALDEAVSSGAIHHPTIWIQTEIIGSRAVIRIADNGPGIPESIQPRLFNPFFTTKPVGKGTGMGLSISYQIVTERHRGTMQCRSCSEHGAEFIVELPLTMAR